MASKKNRRHNNENPGKGEKKRASFGIEPLEKRVLMSASWVDADTGDAQDGSTDGADAFTGTDAADMAHGGNGSDLLEGLGGDDQLGGGGGSDTILGGAGNDTINGGNNADTLDGGTGDDTITGGSGGDLITGGEGNDDIEGGHGNDTIHGDAAEAEWFDETNGGDGYESFGELAAAYQTFENEAEHTISFESMSRGEKLGDQLAETHGVTFENAESSIYNNYAGIQTEGGAIVENLTGYDGSYDENGSNVYLKFANNDPDAPFTVNFNEPVSEVGSMFAVGKEGDVHSVQVTVYDADGEVIGQKVVEPELWDETSSKQNYEGFFQFKSNEANISRVEILNLSQTQFSDALVIDNMAWTTAVEGGNDVLTGGQGDDTIHAGGGDDVINYTVGDGVDVVDGSSGTDEIVIQGVPGEAAHVLVEDGATYAERTGEAVGDDLVIVSVNGEKAIEAQNIEQITFNATTSEDTLEVSGSLAATGLDAGDVQMNAVELDLVAEPMSVVENAEAGTEVGAVTMANATNDAAFTYELADDAGGRFAIDGEGRILVTEGADLNYEGQTSHEVTVRVTDADGETYEEVVDIALSNVEETFFLTGNQTLNASDGPFENVVINGGYLEINGNAVIKADLTIENAARINGGELLVSGDVTTTDTSFHGSATIVLNGDGAQTISTGSGAGELHNVSITNASGEVTIEGDLQISGSYADNGNTVDASGASVELQGNTSVSGGSTTFGDVTVNGGYFEIASMDIDGDLTIENAARINGGELLVSGDVTTTDTSYHGSATIVLDGDGAQSISTGSGAGELHNVSITNTSGEVTIEGDLQISGSYADNGNTVDASGATLELQGNTSVSGGSTTFGDVTVNGGYFEIASMDIDGDLTIENAARINGGELLVSGDVTTTDTSYHGSATIVLNGEGAQTISTGSGTGELHNVSITNTSGEVAIEGNLQISGSYADNGNTVDASGASVELQGNASVSGGSTTFGDVTVNGGYFEIASMDIDGDLTIENAARINGGEILVSGDVTTTDTSYHGTATIVLDGDSAQTISTGSGTGELHNVSITNTSGEVAIEGNLQISGSYADNGNTVDASGATVKLQGNAFVSGQATNFGNMVINGGYMELDGDIYIRGDLEIQNLARLNGGTIYVAGEIVETDTSWHGTGDIQPWEINLAPDIEVQDYFVNEGEVVTLGVEVESPSTINFDESSVESYGGADQDRSLVFETDGDMLRMAGNGWKYVDLDYQVTENTVLEFQFRSTKEGEIHGIGFDNDNSIDPSKTFRLHGTQDWGIDLSSEYESQDGEWVTYRIQVGEHFQGDFNRLTFVNDQDAGSKDCESQFRGIKVYENDQSQAQNVTYTWEQVSGPEVVLSDPHAATPTFEAPEVEDHTDIVFRVTVESEGGSTSEELTVHVDNVNQAPTAIGFTGGTVGENAAAGTVVATASVVDPDAGDTHSYELVDDADGRFSIDANGNIAVAEGADLNYEDAAAHEVTVRVTDAEGESVERSLTIEVGDVNEEIEAITVEAVNPGLEIDGAGEPQMYGFEDAPIGSSPTELVFDGGLTATVEQTDVRASKIVEHDDGHGAVAGEGDRFWKLMGGETTLHFSEPVTEISFMYSDMEWDDVVVSAGSKSFELESGNSGRNEIVTIKAAPGETFSELSFDWNGNSDGVGFDAITVTPARTTTDASISEAAQFGDPVATIVPSDPDAGERFSFRMTDNAGGRFEIDDSGVVRVADGANLDYETAGTHTITVEVEDSAGHTESRELTVSITDANDTHYLDITGGSVSENAPAGTEVASVNVSDADAGQSHTFELVNDGDGRFTIDSDGTITVAEGADIDHEQGASFDITVKVTDDLGESVEQTLTINVGDVNEAPTELSFTGGSVAENAEAGTVVASASVSDADAGDSHSYELVSDAGGRFAIDADGTITVAEGADLNHESASSHTVTVRATDASGETIERELTINVGDMNEAPTELSFTGGNVFENAEAGTVVASASVSDADAGDSHSYELVSDADGRFTIDAAGTITVAEGADLNHEGASIHTVTVRATDASGETIERELTINVGDVNEAPTEVTVTTNAVSEDAQAGTVVASVGVVDADKGDRFTYELADDAGGLFVINPDGTITVAADASLDFETATQHELRVVVTDEGGNTVEQTVTVNVTNANEAEAETAEEETEPAAEGPVRPEPTRAYASGDADEKTEADAQPAEVISNFVENDRDETEVGDNNRTMQWVAEEIDEITQIAHSVDASDIPVTPEADSSDGTSFDEAFVFEDGDGSQLDSGEVLPEEDGQDERVSDGFLSKFWVMLRAGLGTTNKMDAGDSASSAQNAINKLRKRH